MTATIEDRVATFVSDFVKLDELEEAFNDFLVHRTDLDEANFEAAAQEWVDIFKDIAAASADSAGSIGQQEVALRHFVQSMSRQKNAKTVSRMKALLERLVTEKVVSPRQVCEIILNHEILKADQDSSGLLWSAAFSLVRSIISGVDYKGVREIMKLSIDKVFTLPTHVDSTVMNQLSAIKDLLEYIFDREAALLPGYFIVNEILKSYPENKTWPHRNLVPLVSKFLNSFRPTAQMVTTLYRSKLRPVVEYTGKAHTISSWKLDSSTLKFLLKNNLPYERILPYSKDVVEPQRDLVLYILRQPSCKEMINSMMGLQKPRKDGVSQKYPQLEEQLVELYVRTAKETDNLSRHEKNLIWSTIISELIFFILYQYFSLTTFIERFVSELERRSIEVSSHSRDWIMWAILQYVSGSVGKSTTGELSSPLLRLFSLYHNEKETLPIPEVTDPDCVQKLAGASIFILVSMKAKTENSNLHFMLPKCLTKQYQYLCSLLNDTSNVIVDEDARSGNNFAIPVFMNAFSASQELSQSRISAVITYLGASSELTQKVEMPGTNCFVQGPVIPLSMEFLDALSVHCKMSLLHSLVQYVAKAAMTKPILGLSPALVETICRLIAYPETENIGLKSLLHTLLPPIYKNSNWSIYHTLLEIFSYRLHHALTHFKLTLLSNLLVGFGGVYPPAWEKNVQLNLCIESAALRLITGLGNAEIGPQKTPQSSSGMQQKLFIYGDSEELNKVVILVLARSIQVNGLEQQSAPWVKEVLSNIMQKTPHSWPSHTLQNFPPMLQEFFQDNPGPIENRSQLHQRVEEEFNTWTSLSSEADLIQHFSAANNTLFLCVLWKMLLETENMPQVAYKILTRIGCKQLTTHLRSFCDVLVNDFSKSGGHGHVNKCIEAMNNLIWKYNIVSLDRLVLCMALRTYEGNEAQVCSFIIQLLLLKHPEFRTRVNELVKSVPAEHQLLSNFHELHLQFHQNFPEDFSMSDSGSSPPIPIYFGNVCLRFIPVFDIVVHRFLELPPVTKSLETLIDHVGHLYKFHATPITYLYNTLHYYEKRLRDRPALRKKLILNITAALKDSRPPDWALTVDYSEYLIEKETATWSPSQDYYFKLVGRMAQAIMGRRPFPYMDWRFNEFPNEGAHALYVTCVEIMGLPNEPAQISSKILDVVLEYKYLIPNEELPDWINAIGLIMANLPEAFWDGLYQRLAAALSSPPLSQWTISSNPFTVFGSVFEYSTATPSNSNNLHLLLALSHSVFHHAGFPQIQTLPELVKEKFLPVMKTEEQLLFVFHLTGPFLQRLHSERFMRPLFDLTVHYYRMLKLVDKECKNLKYIDSICDILYHVKYQFTGDSVKQDAERIVRELSPALQLRLRFIAPGIIQNQQ